MNREPMLKPRTYNYLCSNGHGAQSDSELQVCPAMVRGKPCDGELKRVGRGSRKEGKQ